MIEVLKQMQEALREYHYYTIDAGLPNQSMLNKGYAAYQAGKQAIAELESQQPVAWVAEDVCEGQHIDGRPRKIWWECEKGVGKAFYAHPPQRTEPVGVMVSMDVSKGDEPEYRIFGRIYEVMKDGEGKDEVTYLAIEDSRNFDTPPQRTWVGLTMDEIALLHANYPNPQGFALALQAKLKERNT
jgi:hypothetical protein